MLNTRPLIQPPLDAAVSHAVLWNRAYRELGATVPLAIALERPDGTVSRFDYAQYHRGRIAPIDHG